MTLITLLLLANLIQPVEVIRDEYNSVHIYAQNEQDLFRVQGYMHAQDRFFQLDTLRRRFSGDLAELVGESALEEDVRNRTLGLRPAAKRSWEVLSEPAKAALQAYAEGVNAFIQNGALPPEYQALSLTQVRPWEPVDSLTISKGIITYLALSIDIERTEKLRAYLAAGKQFGFDGQKLYFEDTHPSAPMLRLATLRQEHQQKKPDTRQPDLPEIDQALRSHLQDFSLLAPESMDIGSNLWGVSGRYSRTGLPIIANDPHLMLSWPAIFYECHLHVKGIFNAFGMSFPGVPGIAHGQNSFIAWGSTNNPMDVSDVFADTLVVNPEKCAAQACVHTEGQYFPVEITEQTFKVNLLNPELTDQITTANLPKAQTLSLTVPFRSFGPVLHLENPEVLTQSGTTSAFTLQYLGLHGTREMETFLHWLRARNLSDFQKGLDTFEVGSQNWIYADKAGHLAYFTSAKIPLRRDLEAGQVVQFGPGFIRPGDGQANWISDNNAYPPFTMLPAPEMPYMIDPPSGMIINANNDPAGTLLDNNPFNQRRIHKPSAIYYLNHQYSNGLRAGKIQELITRHLETHGKISIEHMQAMQMNTEQLDAALLLPFLFNAYAQVCETLMHALCQDDTRLEQTIADLRQWDYATGINSHEALIYNLWRANALRSTFHKTLDKFKLPYPPAGKTLVAFHRLLNHAPFTGKGQSGVDFFQIQGPALNAELRRDLILIAALNQSLKQQPPAPNNWGQLHTAHFQHPLGKDWLTPLEPFLADNQEIPRSGGYEVINASNFEPDNIKASGFNFNAGAARRYVGGPVKKLFFFHGMTGYSNYPGANQADRAGQIALWLEGDYRALKMGKSKGERLRFQAEQ